MKLTIQITLIILTFFSGLYAFIPDEKTGTKNISAVVVFALSLASLMAMYFIKG